MIYKNTKTGITFETVCTCEGEDWIEVKPALPDAEKKAPAKKPAKKKNEQ